MIHDSCSPDPNVPNVIVTRLTLVCSTSPGPLELDLTGEWVLESLGGASWHPAAAPKNNFLHWCPLVGQGGKCS